MMSRSGSSAKKLQPLDFGEHVALAVDHDERGGIGLAEVVHDDVL